MASIQTLQRAMARRTLQSPVGRANASRLRVESLEDRSMPSTSIPLSGVQWTPIGPAPVTTVTAGDVTVAPGNLDTAGGVIQVSADKVTSNVFYAATQAGGVFKTLDGGNTWTPQTDHLSDASIGNNILNRSLYMGSIAASPHIPGLVLAGEGDSTQGQYSFRGRGLLRSTDGGTTWTLQKGPGNIFDNAQIGKIVYNPDATKANIVFATVTNPTRSFLMRSSDYGLTWIEVTTNLPAAASPPIGPVSLAEGKITDFSLDNTNPEIGYVAIGTFGGYTLNGVYRVGGTGAGVSTGAPASMVYESRLGGTSTTLPGQSNPIGSIRVTPGVRDSSGTLSSTVYALVTRAGGGFLGVFRSQDSGVNYVQLVLPGSVPLSGNFFPSGYAVDLLVDPRNSNIVYLAGNNGVSRLDIDSAPIGMPPVVTQTDISRDAAGQGPFQGIHDLEFDANFRVIASTDGGVYRLNSEAPVDWVSVNGIPGLGKGLGSTQTFATSLQPLLDDNLIASTYLNGTINFVDPGGPVVPNDSLYGWTSRDNTVQTNGNLINDFLIQNTVLRSVRNGGVNVRKSTDEGQTWSTANAGIVNPSQIFTDPAAPLENDPSNSGRYYYGTDAVNITTDMAASWSQFQLNLPFVTGVGGQRAVVSALGIGRQEGRYIYAAVNNRIDSNGNSHGPALYLWSPDYRSTDNADHWLDVSPGVSSPFMPGDPLSTSATPLPNSLTGVIYDMTFDPTDNNNIYMVSNTSSATGRVWRTTNALQNLGLTTNWTDISGNLPSGGTQTLRPYSITYDPNKGIGSPIQVDDVVYVATSMGVWTLASPLTGSSYVQLTPAPASFVITSATDNGPFLGTATIATSAAQNYQIGQSISISGVTGAGWNGTKIITASTANSLTFLRGPITANGIINNFTIASAKDNGLAVGTATITTTINHTIQVGQTVNIQGVGGAGWNGDQIVTAITANTLTFARLTIGGDGIVGGGSTVLSSIVQTLSTAVLPDVTVRDVKINTTTGILSVATFGRGTWQYAIRPYISGFVFEDLNGNGLRDPGEGPLAGINVVAIDNNTAGGPAPFANIDSRADGFYAFRSLPNSNYTIVLGDPASYQLTTPTRQYTVTQTFTQTGADLGVFKRTAITGVKFDDSNGDGVRQVGEPGLANWQIQLQRADDNSIVSGPITTALDGSYAFGGLGVIQDKSGGFSATTGYPVVKYRVREINQTDWIQSNANPADIQLVSQTPVPNVNFGNFHTFSISGTKFEDVNGNGTQQPTEAGLGGWVINLTKNAIAFASTTTSAFDGSYSFANLGPGNYGLTETPQPTWGQVTATPAVIPGRSNTNVTGVNFGNFRESTISGTIYEDVNGNGARDASENTPISGATVSLINGSTGATINTTTSNGVGNYSFSALLPIEKPGNTIPYLLRVTLPGSLAQTIPDRQVLLQSGAFASGQDLLVFRRTSLSGQAFEDLNGDGVRNGSDPVLPNFSIALLDANTNQTVATANTDGNGNFTFANLPPTNGAPVPPYKVAITVLGWLQTAGSGAVALTSGVPGSGLFIGAFKQAAFTGFAFNDLNGNGVLDGGEAGLAGWTINLVNTATGTTTATAVTTAGGAYSLLAGPGNFTVREAGQTGWVQTTANPATVTTVSRQVVANQNFGNFKQVTITGTTFHDLNGNGFREVTEGVVTGFTLQLLDAAGNAVATTNSDSTGKVTFAGIGPGTFQVRELPPVGWSTSTPNPVTVPTRSGTNVDLLFGNFQFATVNGTVFEDLNGSGIQDNGETGTTGFTVRLVNAAGTIVGTSNTDANGGYSFATVGGGTYTVRLAPRAGWTQVTANPAAIAPTSGQTIAGGNFGVLRQGSLSGNVFTDGNRNFRKDAFEAGTVGAQIGLYDAAGALVATQTIAADGGYAFVGLKAGSYAVRLVNVPGNLVGTVPASGDYVRDVAAGSTTPGNAVGGLDFPLNPRTRYALAADGGGGPRVQVFDSGTGRQVQDFFAYEESFTGGVRVATADVNGDGIDDLITVAGPGGGPRVRVLSGVDGHELYNFFVYEESFRDGMYVAAGDVNGDGFADIITGTAQGGGPRVAVFSGKTGERLADFFAYDENFRGGVRVGAADTNGDGLDEVITGSGPGGGPNIRVWNAQPLQLLSSFFAFDPSYLGGVNVSGGLPRTDLGGRGTILVGSGANFPNPSVREFDANGRLLTDLPAFSPLNGPYKSEVRVASVDRNGDQFPDIAVAAGPGSPPRLRYIDGRLHRQIGDEQLVYEATFLGGVFIG